MFLIPLVIVKYVLRERISDYGLNLKNYKFGIGFIIIAAVFMLVVIWLVSSFSDLSQFQNRIPFSEYSFAAIVLFQVLFFVYVFSCEFIWRGFMILGLEKEFGINVIFIQTLLFVLLHFNKNIFEVIGAVAGGLILGLLSIRARSMVYGAVIHFLILIFADVISK